MKKLIVVSVCLVSALFTSSPISAASLPTTANTQSTQAPNVVQKMDEKAIVAMVAEAQKMFWQVQTSKTDEIAFTFNGSPYVYLKENFSTKEKITTYFEKIFTKEASNFYFDQAGFEMYQNKVTLINGDFGSLAEWGKATATLVTERPSTKIYSLQVPIGDTGEKEEHYVTVKLIPNLGWRIINSPYDIK